MRGKIVFEPIAFAGLLLVSSMNAGCVCVPTEPLQPEGNLGVTYHVSQEKGPREARYWASSTRYVASFLPSEKGWRQHGLDLVADSLGGVAGAAWVTDNGATSHERVYYSAEDGRVHEGGIDGSSSFSWRGRSDDFGLTLSGRLSVITTPDGTDMPAYVRYIGVVGRVPDTDVYLFWVLRRDDAMFGPDGDVLSLVAPSSNVFGTMQGQVPRMFVVSDANHLISCRRENTTPPWDCSTIESLPPGSAGLQGDGAATSWRDGGSTSTSAIVRTLEGDLWEARFTAPDVLDGWVRVDKEVTGHERHTVSVSAWDNGADSGMDAAFVKKKNGVTVVQRARYSRLSGSWSPEDYLNKPDDVTIDLAGPLLLVDAEGELPNVATIAEQVAGVGYLFSAQWKEERWHSLLDPIVPTGQVTFNNSAHFAEACADERGGHILLAAMRHPGTDYKDPAPAQDVRAAWSWDDGHSFDPHFGFPSDYGDDSKYPGTDWIQGDPAAVVLNPPLNDVGYVMFHELRVAPYPDNGLDGYPSVCSSRIRLFRVDGGQTRLIPGDDEWDLWATEHGKACSSETITGQYLDHPFMAVGPDNHVHIAWYRSDSYVDIPGVSQPEGMFYRSLNGVTEAWDGPSVQIYDEQAKPGLGVPYVVADPNGEGAYVAWNAGGNGDVPPKYRWAVYKCRASSCAATSKWPEDEFQHDGVGTIPFGMMPDGQSIKNLRLPLWTIASTPRAGTHDLAIVYTVSTGPSGAASHDLRLSSSADGGENWAPASFLAATDPSVERFSPSAAFLGDGTLVLTYYQMSPPGRGDNVEPMIAFRDTVTGAWSVDTLAYDWSFDLGNAVHKNYGPRTELFIGDYQVFTGGSTHVHYLRTSPTTNGTATLLRTAAVSEACFRP